MRLQCMGSTSIVACYRTGPHAVRQVLRYGLAERLAGYGGKRFFGALQASPRRLAGLATLGLSRSATEAQVKERFRALAKEHHPDVNAGSSKMAELTAAYSEALEEVRTGAGPEPERPARAWADMMFGDANELFGGTETGARRGADVSVEVSVSFLEAVWGARKVVSVEAESACEACGGSGSQLGAGRPLALCLTCRGGGVQRLQRGPVVLGVVCTACGGSGRRLVRPCTRCAGAGTRARVRRAVVAVPRGFHGGGQLRVAGAGHAGRRGGPPGALLARITVLPDARFAIRGDHVHVTLPVQLHECLLGASKNVQTLRGPRGVAVEPLTRPGATRVLRGEGPPTAAAPGARCGDLHVHLVVQMPSRLTPEIRALAQSLQDKPELYA